MRFRCLPSEGTFIFEDFLSGCFVLVRFCAIDYWGVFSANAYFTAVEAHKQAMPKLCKSTKIKKFQKKLLKIAFSLPTKWGGLANACCATVKMHKRTRLELCKPTKVKEFWKRAGQKHVFAAYKVRDPLVNLDNWMTVQGGYAAGEVCDDRSTPR